MNAELRVLFVDRDTLELLKHHFFELNMGIVEVALKANCRGGRPTLLVYDGKVVLGGWTKKLRRAGALHFTFDVSRLRTPAQFLALESLTPRVRRDLQGPLQPPGGDLTPSASRAVFDALSERDPEFGAHVADTSAVDAPEVAAGKLALIAQQRDQLASLLSIASMDPADGYSRLFEGVEERATLLPVMQGTPREDNLIAFDATFVEGWLRQRDDVVGRAVFTDGGNRMLAVYNINRMDAETAVGSDLVYFHEQRGCLVSVQYKRLLLDGSQWVYRPDSGFRKQLESMKKFDLASQRSQTRADWRLKPSPSLFKFCRLPEHRLDGLAMIPGMYLFREQAEMHVADDAVSGRRGGSLFSYENTDGYLSCTQFADLVGCGLIGSHRAALDELLEHLDARLEASGSVTLGWHKEIKPGRHAQRRKVGSHH